MLVYHMTKHIKNGQFRKALDSQVSVNVEVNEGELESLDGYF